MTLLRQLFRTRLALRSAAITLLVVGVLGIVSLTASVWVTEKRERRQEYQRLEELLDTVEKTAQIACFLNNQELAMEVANGLLNNRIVRRVTLKDSNRTLIDQRQSGLSAENISPLIRPIPSPFNADEEVCQVHLVPNVEEIRNSVVEASVFTSILLILQLLGIGIVVVFVMIRYVTRPISRVSRRLNMLEAETGQKLLVPKGNEQDEIGQLVRSVNAMIDHLVKTLITERDLRKERELAERRFRTIYENVETGIFELDSKHAVVGANPAFKRLFNVPQEHDFNHEPLSIGELVDESPELEKLIAGLEHESLTDVELPLSVEGHPRWVSVVLTPIEAGRVQGVANDVTERRLAAQAAEEMATTDTLTGLGNRRGLDSRLAAAIRVQHSDPSYRAALIMLDLDHFKEANDTFGHAAGDKVLQHVAALLKQLVRKADYVARSGGDEFIVLLDGASEREDLEHIATKFLEQVNAPIPVSEEDEVRVGASLGIAVLGQDASNERDLLRKADAAMYAAKHAGRNTYRFHDDT